MGELLSLSVGRGLWGGVATAPAGSASASFPVPSECLCQFPPGLAPGSSQCWSEQRQWWLLWSSCPGLGWRRLGELDRAFGGLALAWTASSTELAALSGFGPGVLASIEVHRQCWGQDPLGAGGWPSQAPRRVLVPGDPARPASLNQLQRPPLALHWAGRGSLWAPLRRRQAIAVVGTRRPSLHGLAMAEALGAALAEAGWPVVSGLAEGIDAAVHRGCLERGGRPIGVLGTPLDRVYPRHHHVLQEAVARHGLLVSEHPRGTPVRRGHFAARNRLQVALAQAVVVVECPEASGALHSAALAWEQGLPLWVVPADAGKRSALGSNRLLSQGASPLLAASDLIAQLGAGPLGRPEASITLAGTTSPASPPCVPDQALLAALGQGASLEQLAQALGRPAAELATQLLHLELAGHVRAEAGLRWRPASGALA
ncbi:MAG: DNA-processing protein DprA [Prochlorococcaceae cyanobacterium]